MKLLYIFEVLSSYCLSRFTYLNSDMLTLPIIIKVFITVKLFTHELFWLETER